MKLCPRCRRHVLRPGPCPFCGKGVSGFGDALPASTVGIAMVYAPPPDKRDATVVTMPQQNVTAKWPTTVWIAIGTGVTAVVAAIAFLVGKKR